MELSLHPRIIQGGMGIGLSDWRLARAVSRAGELGTVSGTGVWMVLTRRLQDGDPGGHVRRALENFPFPRIAEKILGRYFVEGGRSPVEPYRTPPMLSHPLKTAAAALLVAASFVEVWLAKDGHDGAVAVNYLEKIQLAHLPSLYGAMLAGVDYVIMGAGIPHQIPGALDELSQHRPASYRLTVIGEKAGEGIEERFDPAEIGVDEGAPPLKRPYFLPIISSHVLGAMLLKRSNGRVDGFVVEGPRAGGHNAPPRNRRRAADDTSPLYGPQDDANLEEMRAMGLPFWLAGSYARPGALDEAIAAGAQGIQAGSIFALCQDSALRADLRSDAIEQALAGELAVMTNMDGSPSGFPFKEAGLDNTLSRDAVYDARERICDLGILRSPYRTEDGRLDYRCPGEPVDKYLTKGGDEASTVGKRCLCNALLATISLPQVRSIEGSDEPYVEQPLVTLGEDLSFLGELENPRGYSAADAVRMLRGG